MSVAHLIGIALAVMVGLVMIRLGVEFSEQIQVVFDQYSSEK